MPKLVGLFGVAVYMCLAPQCCMSSEVSNQPASRENAGQAAPAAVHDKDAPPVVQPDATLQLKGSVRGAALLTEAGLAKLGQTSRDLERSTLTLMSEVTRKELVEVRGPNVLPGGVVIQPMPNPTGMAYAGPLPPRPRQLKLLMRQLDYAVKLLANEVAAIIVPDNKFASASQSWEEIRAASAAIEDHYNKLVVLTQSPRPDSLDIGREAVAIHDLADRVNRLRRVVAGLVGQE